MTTEKIAEQVIEELAMQIDNIELFGIKVKTYYESDYDDDGTFKRLIVNVYYE